MNSKLRTAVVLLFLARPGIAAAQESGAAAGGGGDARMDAHLAARPMMQAVRASAGISVDGVLDDAVWSRVQPATDFIQTDPDDGAPATERTEVRIAYDDDAIYVGARLFDSKGDVRKRLGRRDSYLSDSDWFYINFDSYHGHQNAYQFAVNPAGVKRDAISNGGEIWRDDSSWDAVWDVSTVIDAEGWTVEMRIPFSQLRFSAAEIQTWGIQVTRRIISRDEVVVLAHTPKSEKGGPQQYAHLLGLQGIRPGKRAEVLPYVAGRAEYVTVDANDPFRSGEDWYASAGVDLKYRVTSSMTLDATLNPDFGQVEVDPATINLSAFEQSFDEKRPFFVEGADIFRFGELRMFYSRRIGRAPQGGMPSEAVFSDRPDVATILGAGKLTGRSSNGWRVGALTALTAEETARYETADGTEGETPVEPMTGFAVGRLERSFRNGESSIGGMFTALHRSGGNYELDQLLRSDAYAGGIDFSHEFANRTWQIEGYLAGSTVSGSENALVRTQLSSSRYYQRPDADYLTLDSTRTNLTGYAGRLSLRKTAGLHWRGDANVSMTSPGLEINDVGFQTGVDRIGADLNVSYVENRPSDLFRNWRISLRNSRDWNYGGDNVGGRTQLSLNGSFQNFWGGSLNLNRQWESFDDRFTRGGPVALDPAGWQVSANLNSDSRLPLSGRLNAEIGGSDAGAWSRRLSLNLTLRPAETWTISAGPSLRQNRTAAQYITSFNDPSATLTYGRAYVFAPLEQTTVSMETRLNVNFTPTISLDVFLQPFVATGDYEEAMTLRAARTFDFDPYESDVNDRDFVSRSLRGNAVLRWEWQPGSTLFLVWQQRRSGSLDCATFGGDSCENGRFAFGRDARALFDERPDNVFQVKMTWWLNL